MKRNLMDELKEGMDALTEDRHMTKNQHLENYARIIYEQQEYIKELKEQLDKSKARVDKLSLLLGNCI